MRQRGITDVRQNRSLRLPHPTVPSSAVQPGGTQPCGRAGWRPWRCNWSHGWGPHAGVGVGPPAGVSLEESSDFLGGNGKRARCWCFAKSPVPPCSAGRQPVWFAGAGLPPPWGWAGGRLGAGEGCSAPLRSSPLRSATTRWQTSLLPRSVGPLAGSARLGTAVPAAPQHTARAGRWDGDRQKDLGGRGVW